MIYRPKKIDYECKICGYILSDEETYENNCICNNCLVHGNENEEDCYSWLDYK